MKRRLVSSVMSMAIAVGVFVANPWPVEASCSQAKVTVYENHGFNGDTLVVCFGANLNNLANVFNGCGAGGSWDNCISSAKFQEFAGTNTTVCLYSEPGYVSQIWKGTNNNDSVQWFFPPNDWTSSIKFGC